MQHCWICDIGLTEYEDAWMLQNRLGDLRREEAIDSVILFTEHKPVITCGSTSDKNNILWSESEIKKHGIEVIDSDRGGDVTLHCPGQLVAYMIFKLDYRKGIVRDLVRELETSVINTLANYGLDTIRKDSHPGVFKDDRQISAIGMHLRQSVTSHGISLNVKPDLELFDSINPCGLKGVRATSMEKELNKEVDMIDVKNVLANELKTIFDLELEEISSDQIWEECRGKNA